MKEGFSSSSKSYIWKAAHFLTFLLMEPICFECPGSRLADTLSIWQEMGSMYNLCLGCAILINSFEYYFYGWVQGDKILFLLWCPKFLCYFFDEQASYHQPWFSTFLCNSLITTRHSKRDTLVFQQKINPEIWPICEIFSCRFHFHQITE